MKLKNILFIIVVLFAFVACNEDKEPVLHYPTTPNVLNSLSLSSIELIEDNKDDDALTLSWTQGEEPSAKVAIQYSIQFDVAGNNFENAKTLDETVDQTYTIDVASLNEFLTTNFSQEPFTFVDYEIRIVSFIKGKDDIIINLPETASNSHSVSISTYEIVLALYMIGADFGDWEWNSDGVVEMTPVNDADQHYWCIRYFTAGNGFKWSPKRAWDGDFNTLSANDSGFITDGGNAVVETSGIYSVYIDYANGKITIEPAQVYGMGDCFGGWDAGAYPFTANGQVMEITTLAEGELRMYANSSASIIGGDWWKMEFIILNGKIVYRGNGGDQERVNVAAGKKITLDFNAGTGTIE